MNMNIKVIAKRIVSLLMCVVILSGCNVNKEEETSANLAEKDEYYFGTFLCEYDMHVYSGGVVGICIPFIYKGGKDNIKLLNVKGENISADKIELFDDTIKSFDEVEKEGYKFGFVSMVIRDCVKNFKINEVKVEINSNIVDIEFDNQITVNVEEEDTDIFEMTTTDAINGDVKKVAFICSFLANKNIIIDGIEVSEGYKLNDCFYAKNKKEVQIPTSMDEEDILYIESDIVIDNSKMYKNGNITLTVNYHTEDGEEKKYYFTMIQQGAGNKQDFEKVIDMIIEKEVK